MLSSSIKTLLPAFFALVAATNIPLPPGTPRSVLEFREKHPYQPSHLLDRARHVITIRHSANDTDDVSADFKAGLERANHGGTLYLPANQTFVIGQPLDLTFLDDVQVRLDGEVLFTNDTSYWQSVAFTHPFQNSIMFWKWGGNKVKIYGEGVLNGNGQRWWNEFAGNQILDPDNTYLRPILFYAQNATDWVIEGIHFKDSPCWNNFIVTSSGFEYKDVVVTAVSNADLPAKNASSDAANTDFFDSLNLDHLTVERTWVNNGDDCFSPKANTTDIYVNTMYCNGSHGQSMGSIGEYSGELDIIENVHIENVWMINGEFGGRLKSWAGPDVGYGYINNVTFKNFYNANNGYAAYLDSCYFDINSTECAAYPSQVNVTNVTFDSFSGYTSGAYGRAVASLTCSSNPNAVCENIVFKNFTVTSPCSNGTDNAVVICNNIAGGIGIPCVNSTSAEAIAALADTCTVPLATLPEPTPWAGKKR
ncbi:family 28 glycoside hydrolase [Cryphonectria parasitica EP155]|uniref:galacturonan 1,4-alpha-galacturonidase n=1 Tax=Cryphonectria parasitica (strain ATCC 38755 / EP155) TaxID=660469 RepID=A0A9P4Y4W1_CRYP1|nr:family 28 glycoside hydrolase [Cryphonectria parasitica EP155]KAF3766972.1 family 28 glycoside hydrolase [Cryphonectria parasitica EP155]